MQDATHSFLTNLTMAKMSSRQEVVAMSLRCESSGAHAMETVANQDQPVAAWASFHVEGCAVLVPQLVSHSKQGN